MRFDNLDLNLIIALEAILRLRSVSAAAEELNLTQPAISRALGRLREHFSDKIAVPVGRQMVPTDFGEHLFGVARQLLEEMRIFADMRPDFDPATASREVTIMTSDYVIRVFLAKVARDLSRVAPGVSLRFVSIDGLSDTMFEQTAVDFRIVPKMALLPDHPHAELFSDSFVCVVWKDNPYVGDMLDRETFVSLKHVTTAFGARVRDSHFERFMRDSDIKIQTAMSMPSFILLPEGVIGTPYIATIHARLAALLPDDLPIRKLPVPVSPPPLVENLQWHHLRHHDSASRWLRNFMIEAAGRA